MNLQGVHHVAYRCLDARQTVHWYRDHLDMDFVLAIAENEVPSTKAPDPYMHIFMDAGGGNILAFFELPNSPAMGRDTTFFADLAGNRLTQQRCRTSAQLTAVHVGDGGFDDMRTCAPPAGRGFEYLLGTGWDWEDELSKIPEYLDEKTKSPSVEAGLWDLVIDPTNLWLTIHESIGHATELDRALGYEANYAGSSFATIDKLNNFRDRKSTRLNSSH